MSTTKRPRACDQCHAIKIKCELGSVGGIGPCERCVRLGKDCKVTPPKTQKDRVAELEAQVEQLTKLLNAQNIDVSSADSSSPTDNDTPSRLSPSAAGNVPALQKKRKVEADDSLAREETVPTKPEDVLARLDVVVDQPTQDELLQRYLTVMAPMLPLVPIAGNAAYAALRPERPFLLQAAIFAASIGVQSYDVQDQLGMLNWETLSQLVLVEKRKSLELLQAIHISYLWNRVSKNHSNVSPFDLVLVGEEIAKAIGVGRPFVSALESRRATTDRNIDSEAAWRSWLTCRILCCSIGIYTRRPDPYTWTEGDEISLQILDYWQEKIPGTRLICQITKSEKLSEWIAAESGFYDLDTCTDVSDSQSLDLRIRLQSAVLDYNATITPRLDSDLAHFFRLTTMLTLHEPVLHTATNKRSFRAPYLAESLSVTDFPMPVVKQEHITSLVTLQSSANALLDCYLALPIQTQVLLPAVLVTARVAYAQHIMMRIYVAATAPGNTFGAFFDPETLQIEKYHRLMLEAGKQAAEIDANCGATRVMSGSTRMQEWYQQYKSTYLAYPTPISANDYGTGAEYFENGTEWNNFDDPAFAMPRDSEEFFTSVWENDGTGSIAPAVTSSFAR